MNVFEIYQAMNWIKDNWMLLAIGAAVYFIFFKK
jgi:hypothetical protein